MLRIGKKGGTSVVFKTLDKSSDLSFIDKNPSAIYMVDISAVLNSLPAYKAHLEKKLRVYTSKYNLTYSFYKEWVIIGDVSFVMPKLEIIR